MNISVNDKYFSDPFSFLASYIRLRTGPNAPATLIISTLVLAGGRASWALRLRPSSFLLPPVGRRDLVGHRVSPINRPTSERTVLWKFWIYFWNKSFINDKQYIFDQNFWSFFFKVNDANLCEDFETVGENLNYKIYINF